MSINWAAANSPPAYSSGFTYCPDCGKRKDADAFMWVNGSKSIRCLSCLDKRERGRGFMNRARQAKGGKK